MRLFSNEITFSQALRALMAARAPLQVMYKQSRNNMYRGSVFYISKSLAEIPATFVNSLLITAVTPTLSGFQIDGDHWIYFLLCHFVLAFAATNLVKGFVFLGSDLFNGCEATFSRFSSRV